MHAIILDMEYTTWEDALRNGWSGPGQHREIVQMAAIGVDADFVEQDHLDVIVKPGINAVVSDFFTALTGITQDRIDSEGVQFDVAMHRLLRMTNDGNVPVICMNADEMVMRENCRLYGKVFPFATGFHRLRPFLASVGIDTRGVSSGDLHGMTDHPLEGHVHNALHDVRSMACWLRQAKRIGDLTSLDQLPTTTPEIDPRIAEAQTRNVP